MLRPFLSAVHYVLMGKLAGNMEIQPTLKTTKRCNDSVLWNSKWKQQACTIRCCQLNMFHWDLCWCHVRYCTAPTLLIKPLQRQWRFCLVAEWSGRISACTRLELQAWWRLKWKLATRTIEIKLHKFVAKWLLNVYWIHAVIIFLYIFI